MKAVLLAIPPPVGGIAKWTERMMNAELKNVWEVSVVDEKLISNREVFGNHVKRSLTTEIIRCNKIWRNLRNELKDPEAKVVHSCIPSAVFSMLREYVCACITKKRKRKFIIHFRCTVPNTAKGRAAGFMLKRLCNKSDMIILLNGQSVDYLKNMTDTPVALIPNFIDDTEICAEHTTAPEIKTALYVGGVIKTKGCADIVDVARAFPNINFRLVGRADDEITAYADGLKNVVFTGVKEKFGTPVFFNVQDLWPENVEVVLGIHNKLVINVINKIVDKIYSASDKILCSSNGFVENIKARGVPAEKLVFWPQFCDKPNFTNAEKPEIYCDDDFKIVFAGNIGEAQGLDLLLETARRLKNRNNIKFYIVGNGRARKRLEETAKANELQNVLFAGKVSVDEADRYIHFADCAYLSFKDNEVFNMTIPAKLQSYMACGTPILVAAGGESAEIIKKADCGFISERNPVELSGIIERIAGSSNEIAEMRKNAYEFYSRNFKKENTVDYLESIMSHYVSGNVQDLCSTAIV